MITQNNPTPWVILALVVLVGCGISGMLLANAGPFDPQIMAAKAKSMQTQDAIDAYATQSSLVIAQTQQAPMIQQTIMVAQLTNVPLQQTATQNSVDYAIHVSQAQSTQTAMAYNDQISNLLVSATQTTIANDLILQNLAYSSTATAIADDQKKDKVTGYAGVTFIGFLILVISSLVTTRGITRALMARAQDQKSRANLLAEQRKSITAKTTLRRPSKATTSSQIFPRTLIIKPENKDKLPRAE